MVSLTRRQFCLAGAAISLLGGRAMAQPERSGVPLPDGSKAPALGQGSWHLAQGRHPAEEEENALRTGIALGMTLLDTAEMYGNGSAERLIGRVIAGQRDKVFLVSKVLPYHATTADGIRQACQASLARLGTHYLDLYLLHWRGGVSDLGVVVNTFESLRSEGRIRHWGVSNFDVGDMEDLFRVPGGNACATNQVLYNLTQKGIEEDLLPWCVQHKMPIMAYSPLGMTGGLLGNTTLRQVAARHQVGPGAVALAWTMRSGHVIPIPESGSPDHVKENALALSLRLTEQDVNELAQAF
ncbi:aldo/keto reductase [Sodalis ligni]|uniref:aldo/keto reductase n=1 Tax=Sodalis ligni TaxID=2697027 RepID=UPI002096A146|nr:aldo/keto reductase [Sodalis ligni]